MQSKSKKNSKLDLFGFEDADSHMESDDASDGASRYKIKYFGFDDMSDSDGDDSGDISRSKERRRAKMAAADVVDETPTQHSPDLRESLDTVERLSAKERKKSPDRTDRVDRTEKTDRTERTESRTLAGMHAHTHTQTQAAS